MAYVNHITVLLEDKTVKEAEAFRDKGKDGHVQESNSSLYGRLIKHGLAHAGCKEGKLNK